MRAGSLFSGIGGLDLGVEWALDAHPAFFCETDEYCRAVLERHWPGVPIVPDVREIDESLGPVDVLHGGYPCQPFSVAGLRQGEEDPRHLWPAMARAIRLLRPRVVVGENVAGHLALGFGRVLGDLAEMGLDVRWGVVRASDAGAPHRRERLFFVATDPRALRVDADTGVRRGDPRVGDQPGRAPLPAGAEVARPADALEDRAGAAGDTDSERSVRDAAAEGQMEHPEVAAPRREAAADAERERPHRGRGPDQGDEAAGRPDRRADAQGHRASPADADRPGLEGPQPARRRDLPTGSSHAPPHPGGDGRVRVEEVDGPHRGMDVEHRHQPDRRDLGTRGPHDGHDREAPPDADGERPEPRSGRRAPSGDHARADEAQRDGGRHLGPSEPGPWGPFDDAVRRWEHITGAAAPRPTDDRGRLMPEFVEWMMGLPVGWTAGAKRTHRLRMLGNSVVAHQAELALNLLLRPL